LAGVSGDVCYTLGQNVKYGLLIRVELYRVRDGDTVEVQIPGLGWVWAIRIKNIDCPERYTDAGKLATRYTLQTLTAASEIALQVEFPTDQNPLKHLSFDRIPADLVVMPQEKLLSDLLLEEGHATRWTR
jgi:endonuclease YncB( thermonuclease family)